MTRHTPRRASITKATVTDVARLAGVSTATVSRVMNGLGVSGRTRENVLKAVSELRFSPNLHAAQLARSGNGVPKGKGRKQQNAKSDS